MGMKNHILSQPRVPYRVPYIHSPAATAMARRVGRLYHNIGVEGGAAGFPGPEQAYLPKVRAGIKIVGEFSLGGRTTR